MVDDRSETCPVCGGWLEIDEVTGDILCDTCDYDGNCPCCDGTGQVDGQCIEDIEICGTCNGTGKY